MSPQPFPPHAGIGWSAYPGEAPRTVVASGSVIGHRFAGLRSAASDSAPAENVEEHANHLSCSIPPRLVPGPCHAARTHASTLSRRQASAGRGLRRPTPEGRTPHVSLPSTADVDFSGAGGSRSPGTTLTSRCTVNQLGTSTWLLARRSFTPTPSTGSAPDNPGSASRPAEGRRPHRRQRGSRPPGGRAGRSPRGRGWSSSGGARAAWSS